MCFAQKTARLSVRQIAAAAPHQFRQHYERRQITLAPEQMARHRADVRCLYPTGKPPPRLHDLPARIVHRRAAVMHRPHQRKLIGHLRVQRQYFGNIDVRRLGANGFERPAILRRRLRFHVPQIHVAWRAQVENHNARAILVPRPHRAGLLRRQQLRQRQSCRAQHPHLQKLPPLQMAPATNRRILFCQKIKH